MWKCTSWRTRSRCLVRALKAFVVRLQNDWFCRSYQCIAKTLTRTFTVKWRFGTFYITDRSKTVLLVLFVLFVAVRHRFSFHCCVWWIVPGIVITSFGKKVLVFLWLWLMYCLPRFVCSSSWPRWFSWMRARLVIRRLPVRTPPGRQHSFVEIDQEIFSKVILFLPLIQIGQLSVSGERMCTIMVNRLQG